MSNAGCNTVSTAEQAVLCILSIVRNYPIAHRQIMDGRWDLAEASSTAYDLEGKHVGCAAGPHADHVLLDCRDSLDQTLRRSCACATSGHDVRSFVQGGGRRCHRQAGDAAPEGALG